MFNMKYRPLPLAPVAKQYGGSLFRIRVVSLSTEIVQLIESFLNVNKDQRRRSR
jgi:hypothetical protein